MPTIPKLSTSGNDLTPIDPTAVLMKVLGLIDQTPSEYADDVQSHVCELEPESNHWGPCGPKCYDGVLSRSHYMRWLDHRLDQDPELKSFVQEKKSIARAKYKLEEYSALDLDIT